MTLDNKTSTEESLVDELRHRMKEHMPQDLHDDDHFFLRFLRARNHNIDAAETMLRNHMNFRRQYKVDSILSDFTPHKPFICGPTQKKIKMFGKTGWREELLQHVSPDVLPVFLGGNRTDPDGNPMCKTLMKFGGVVPECLFAYDNKNFNARLPGAKKLTVNRLSKAEVTLQVLHLDSTVEWEFVVKQRDVGFGVLYREHIHSEAREVIPQQRIETSESTESGMCKCEKSGIYTIEFDNSYSWIHRKEIYYKVSVELPPKNVITT